MGTLSLGNHRKDIPGYGVASSLLGHSESGPCPLWASNAHGMRWYRGPHYGQVP